MCGRACPWPGSRAREMPTFDGENPPADERACPGVGAGRDRAARQLQQQPPAPAEVHTRGFGGDRRLVVEVVEQRGFEQLGGTLALRRSAGRWDARRAGHGVQGRAVRCRWLPASAGSRRRALAGAPALPRRYSISAAVRCAPAINRAAIQPGVDAVAGWCAP